MLDIKIGKFFFSFEQLDCPVGAVLHIIVSNRSPEAYRVFKRSVRQSFCLIKKLPYGVLL